MYTCTHNIMYAMCKTESSTKFNKQAINTLSVEREHFLSHLNCASKCNTDTHTNTQIYTTYNMSAQTHHTHTHTHRFPTLFGFKKKRDRGIFVGACPKNASQPTKIYHTKLALQSCQKKAQKFEVVGSIP